MGKIEIIGRNSECSRLEQCMQAQEAQLVLIYGRRRVGKTFLVNRFFDDRFDFKFTGEYGASAKVQLTNFANELAMQKREAVERPQDWTEAFLMLRTYLESLSDAQKTIVFFDEMPWMDTPRSGFLSAFEYFWNSWGSSQCNLIFIICGSATSWMRENIINNKGGLYNRLTCRIYPRQFDLYTTEKYLRSRGIEWSRYDVTQCYMIMGGIPYYLRLLDRELSINENIDKLFFVKRAELWDEFGNLYNTLFSNSGKYIEIVRALATKRRGLTREEIVTSTKVANNGLLTKMLSDLEDSDLIRPYRVFGNKKKGRVYQLADYYTLFYFKFIDGKAGIDEHFWSNSVESQSRMAWAGYTFEQVCMDHLPQIKQKLGIAAVRTEQSVWYNKSDDVHKGAQIDLLLDRQDRIITICEIKFSTSEFAIDKEYDMKLRDKMGVFRDVTGTKKGIGLAMITTYGVKKNMYSGIVNRQVMMDDLFFEED